MKINALIPAYSERPQKLDRAIRSVLAQNHPDLTLHLLLSGPSFAQPIH